MISFRSRTILGLIIILFVFTSLNAGVTDDLVPCVIFLMQDVEPGQQAKIGSGFLVRKDNSSFIVTACHVAKEIGRNIRIILPRKDGHADEGRLENVEWIESPTADVALAKITLADPEHLRIILDRSVPIHLLSARPLPPSRDIPLTVMGYPLGLGVSGYVSPLSLETKAVSGFITLNRFDNNMPATFILLQDPSIGGLSGGPVFDTGKSYFSGGRQMQVREGVSVVGIIHGVISDKTGGKFAAVVPATEIVKLIEAH
jgi:hypothetical protein